MRLFKMVDFRYLKNFIRKGMMGHRFILNEIVPVIIS